MGFLYTKRSANNRYFVGCRVWGFAIYQWIRKHLKPISHKREMARRRRQMNKMVTLKRGKK